MSKTKYDIKSCSLPDFVRSVRPLLFLSLVFCTYIDDFETIF